MKRLHLACALPLLVTLILTGCGPNRNKTHEADLLDNRVLQQRVELALQRAGPDLKDVHARANDGTVVLSGTVSSPKARSHAEEIARSVYRVDQVTDDIQVNSTSR